MVTKVVSGTTPRTDDADAWNGEVVWVTPADLGQLHTGRIAGSSRRITRAGVLRYGLETAPPGSVVMSSRAPIGHLALADVSVVTNQGCKSFVPGSDIDGEFLYWLLRYRMDDIRALGAGATFAEVSKSTLERFEIAFPPVDEQRRIAARLRDQLAEVGRVRSAMESKRSVADDLLVALLRQTFAVGDKRPTTQLRHVIRPRNEIVHPRDSPTGLGTFVGLEHVEPQTGRRIGQEPLNLAAMTGRKAQFAPRDILYGYLRPYLNKVWIAEFAGFCSVDQYVFVVDSAVADVEYVAWYLRSPTYLDAAPVDETPGQLPRIRLDEVLSTPIPLPPIADQRRIAARLREQFAEIDRATTVLEAQRLAVDALPAALLREVFGPAAPGGSATPA